MTELSESFYITLIATVSAMFGFSLRMCLRSRCNEVNLFCLKIRRDVDLEHEEVQNNPDATMQDLEHGKIYKSNSEQNITL